ncbi:L,D-transpeptidase family protein [Flavisphingomonas formosensis]|uniref:L,D-transpeptidase family protein n=1 Tax=Flavisphingomonas formosensis TaxID=861534 RepID=UPI001E5DFCCF|nr:L,D-transpeptidase family protein [Sphingomonas formosensis]
MRKRWLFLPAAALILASPTVPVTMDYDFSELLVPGDCDAWSWTGCSVVESRAEALAEARARAEAEARRRAAIAAGLRLVVSIPEQRLYVIRQGNLITTSVVSTGMRGHATPAGTFTILGKAVKHSSNIYSNAPMPYMQRLTNGGIALHAGHVPGYPASHGCIRLPYAFARQLYAMTDWTTRVIITREAPGSAEAAASLSGWRSSVRNQAAADETGKPALAYATASPMVQPARSLSDGGQPRAD